MQKNNGSQMQVQQFIRALIARE